MHDPGCLTLKPGDQVVSSKAAMLTCRPGVCLPSNPEVGGIKSGQLGLVLMVHFPSDPDQYDEALLLTSGGQLGWALIECLQRIAQP